MHCTGLNRHAPPVNTSKLSDWSVVSACVRFNDLDNIGVTGRHYSGFVMMGIQVFNYPGDFKFFKDETLEFQHNWLINGLGVNPDEVTYIEDVWSGGGNLGPSLEYFIRGMEVGNMVFT